MGDTAESRMVGPPSRYSNTCISFSSKGVRNTEVQRVSFVGSTTRTATRTHCVTYKIYTLYFRTLGSVTSSPSGKQSSIITNFGKLGISKRFFLSSSPPLLNSRQPSFLRLAYEPYSCQGCGGPQPTIARLLATVGTLKSA